MCSFIIGIQEGTNLLQKEKDTASNAETVASMMERNVNI